MRFCAFGRAWRSATASSTHMLGKRSRAGRVAAAAALAEVLGCRVGRRNFTSSRPQNRA
jgi:hypothetical protein